MCLALAPSDQLDLGRLSLECRTEVEQWLTWLQPVMQAKSQGLPVVAAMQRVAVAHNQPFANVSRKWYRFVKLGWRGLVNQAKNPLDRDIGLPKLFVQWWKDTLEMHQRDKSGRQARRVLLTQWRAWRGPNGIGGDESCALPGYETCPEPEKFTGYPRGWSHINLMRNALTKYEKALRRQGPSAAKRFLPSVRTTRVGMLPMEMIMPDDQWHDTYTNFIGRDGYVINKRATRPLSFNMLDVLSGCDFTRGYKPIIWDDTTETRKMLTEQDFMWFIIHVFTEFGWREDTGTMVAQEHGTAHASATLQRALADVSGGKISFSASGIAGAPLRKGMFFEGASKGNPKFKAHRESWFNLFRNHMCALPGSTGLNPEMAPEESHGLLRYNNMLLKAMAKLGPQRSSQLMMPILEWNQYVKIADAITEVINQREDHDLEGWETVGFIAQEVRLRPTDDQWLTLADIARLGDANAQGLAMSLMSAPGHGRLRRLSPREVFDQGRREAPMTKLNPHLWHMVIPNDYARIVRVTDTHEIIVNDRTIAPEPLRFASLVRTAKGREEIIPAGEQVRVYVNPYRPDQALVCELNDAAIGLASALSVPMRTDLDGMARVHGSIRHLESHLQRESVQRAEGLMIERRLMQEHNQNVLDGEPVTDAEHASATRMKQAARSADEAIDAEAVGCESAGGNGGDDEEAPDPFDS